MRILALLCLTGYVVALAGCRVTDERSGVASGVISAELERRSRVDVSAWLRQFDSPEMQAAVREAAGGNKGLQAAAARMRQARFRAVRSGASLLPEVEATGQARQTGTYADKQWDRKGDYSLGLAAVWEVDVWGRVNDAVTAAQQEAGAAQHDFAAARLSLSAAVARAWCNLAEAEQQLQLGRRTVESFQRNLKSVDRAFDLGVASGTALDVRLGRSGLATAEANVASRERSVDEARRSLEELLGRFPAGAVAAGARLPKLKGALPTYLRSDLLLRRPDIRAADMRVAAALRSEAAARKALLPSVRLTTALRAASEEWRELLDLRRLTLSLAASLAQPVFAGGRLRVDIAISGAQREELAAEYAATALRAFREVETAVAASGYLDAQIAALRTAAVEAEAAVALASSQYEKGLGDFLRLLESQRRAFDGASGLLRAENARLQNRIDLGLALGGGF